MASHVFVLLVVCALSLHCEPESVIDQGDVAPPDASQRVSNDVPDAVTDIGLDTGPDSSPAEVKVIPPPLQCRAEGGPCDFGDTRTPGFQCVKGTDGTGVCREACDPDADDCGSDQRCFGYPTDADAFCLDEFCSSFFEHECGPGTNCLVQTIGVCVPAGKVQLGEPCPVIATCDIGLLCVSGVCIVPECSVDGYKKCPAGSQCVAYHSPGFGKSDVGYCETAPN